MLALGNNSKKKRKSKHITKMTLEIYHGIRNRNIEQSHSYTQLIPANIDNCCAQS